MNLRNLFAGFPVIFLPLLLLYGLDELLEHAITSSDGISLDYDDYTTYFFRLFRSYSSIIKGFLYIVAGFLLKSIPLERTHITYFFGGLLASFLLMLLPFTATFILGRLVFMFSSALLMLAIYHFVAVLFPIANDFKDNAFILLAAVVAIVNQIISLPYMAGRGLGEFMQFQYIGYSILIFVILAISLKAFEFPIIIEEEEEEDDWTNAPVLLGCLAVYSLTYIMSSRVSSFLGGYMRDYEDMGFYYEFGRNMSSMLGIFLSLLSIVLFLFWVYYRLQSRKESSHQVDTISVLLFGYAGFMLLTIGVIEMGRLAPIFSEIINTFYRPLLWWVNIFLLFPMLYSILTHVKTGRKGIFWLGILFGIPILINNMSYKLLPETGMLFLLVLAGLGFALAIYLMNNKQAIKDALDLETPNIEFADEENTLDNNADPYEHLIGK